MTPESFRLAGHELIDWISDYRNNLDQHPVRAQVAPGDIRGSLPSSAPELPESLASVVADLDKIVVPGITQVQHPMHYGWFPSNASLASVLGDIASSGLGTLGISWESCPALTEVEEVVCDWMRQLTGLSAQWEGTIHDTASTACLTALILAREKASNYAEMGAGLQGQENPLVIYTTSQAHSSITKAALLAGYGKENIRMIDVDPSTYGMSPRALREGIEEDLKLGRKPAAIIASVGSTGVTAIDPVDELSIISNEYDIWLHVDAAMAGSAMLLEECRFMWEGVEQSDSISWNPHKWMGTILDCSLFYVKDPEHLIRVMSTNPSYLRSAVDGEVTQYRDWGIPLGRRFRGLKLWFHLRLDGVEAIRQRIRRDLENTRWLADQIEQTENWKVVAPVTLQTVCVRHEPGNLSGEDLDKHTLNWVDAINRSGEAFMSPSIHDGLWMVRISVGVESTEREHLERLWALIQNTVIDID
ncbi:MAG: aspartate aminotransferase family protein [Gammaproteobacteria bacterium]|nr:aspartate aminotransferase family protein [Gammaproteobacteria bacterium]